MKLLQRLGVCVILLGNTLLSSFAYAADCATCSKSPSEMDKYFRTIEELIMLVDTSQDPDTGGLAKDIAVAVEAATDVTTTSLIMAGVLTIQTSGNMFSTLATMYRSESLRRDWDKLTDIDMKIARRALDMAQASRQNDKIPVDVLEQIDATLQKLEYVKLAQTADGTYFMDINNASYTEYVDLLWKLNRFYKRLHQKKWYDSTLNEVGMGYWATDDLEDDKATNAIDKDKLAQFIDSVIDLRNNVFWFCQRVVTESPETECSPVTVLDFAISGEEQKMKELLTHIWQIQDDYACSTGLGNECNEWADVKEKSKELFADRLVTDVNKSIDTFRDAWGRLMGTLHGPESKNYEASQQRKEALTSNYRGPSWSKDGEEGRFITRTKIDEAPQEGRALRKAVSKVFEKKDRDLVSKDKERQTFNERKAGRTIGKFWFIKDKDAQEPSNADRPDAQGDDLKYQEKSAKEAKIAQEIGAAWANEKFKWEPGVLDTRSRNQAAVLDNKIASFRNTFQHVLSIQNQMEIESIYSDVNRVTHQFPALSAGVYQNMELIGKKNSEGKLYHAMGNVCELQCTNLGTKCRYHAE